MLKNAYNASLLKFRKVLKSCLNSRAVSLTEALIAAGMVGGLSLGYLQLSKGFAIIFGLKCLNPKT